jgi:hypothetical protein
VIGPPAVTAYEPVRVAAFPPVSTTVHLMLSVWPAWLNVTQFLAVWAPQVLVPERDLKVNEDPAGMTKSNDELKPATELCEAIETLPAVVMVTDEPRRFSAHVVLVVGLLEKKTLSVQPLPLASIVAVAVDVGHLMVTPPCWICVFVDESEMAPPAGVLVALAGVAATASAQSMAVAKSRRCIDAVFMTRDPLFRSGSWNERVEQMGLAFFAHGEGAGGCQPLRTGDAYREL